MGGILKSTVLLALLGGLPACLLSAESASPDSSNLIVIDDRQLDAAHGWIEIAEGVYQRVDPVAGTVSTVSVGEAGKRHDHHLALERLTLVRRQLANAVPGSQHAADLRVEIAELEETVASLTSEPTAQLVEVLEETSFCHNVRGTFLASFDKDPRAGGGNVGTVSSEVRTVSCLGFECVPFDGFQASGYNGRTYARARASNSGGQNTVSRYSNNGAWANMYTYPWASATTTTPNVSDVACSLQATGWVDSTYATTPYESCYLYRSFAVIKTCAQVP